MFAVNPGILASGVSTGKTYADFEAWTLTQGAVTSPPSGSGWWNGFGLHRVRMETYFTGNMYGSPWGGPPSYGDVDAVAQFTRIAQHAALSLAHATMNLGRIVLIDVRVGPTSGLENSIYGRDRNGFQSYTYPYDPDAYYNTAVCRRFDYFNDATGRRVRVDPYLQTFEELDF